MPRQPVETADDFADIFGISTAAPEQPQEAQPIKPEPPRPQAHDAFWDDFGPSLSSARPAEKKAAAPKDESAQSEEFSVDDILAEFKDL